MNDERDASVPTMDASKKEWLTKLQDRRTESGGFEALGARHYAVLTDGSPTLLVTFETVESIREDRENELPLGVDLVAENGWSHLGIIADGDSWFRDETVYNYFDQLIDDGFFEEFDQVIFMGAGMCGYAAAAYSVAAPGCTVIAFSPLATLDPNVAEWDHRFASKRRISFTERYGYAPDMIEAAKQVFVLYDPEEEMDAMHAALFTRPHVTKLRCRYLGHHILQDMIHMDILQPLLDTAGSGGDTARHFFSLFRSRRKYAPFLRRLLRRLDDDDRCMLSGLLCRHVANRMKAPRFERRLNEIESRMAKAGSMLPTQRAVKKRGSASFPRLT